MREGPPDRLMLIMDRHERLKERKRQDRTAKVALNVRDHGAKGDGLTDDTAAIQRAIDSATATLSRADAPQGVPRIRNRHGPAGIDWCAILREIGSPCTQEEITTRAKSSAQAFAVWFLRGRPGVVVTRTPYPIKGRYRKLYSLAGSISPA